MDVFDDPANDEESSDSSEDEPNYVKIVKDLDLPNDNYEYDINENYYWIDFITGLTRAIIIGENKLFLIFLLVRKVLRVFYEGTDAFVCIKKSKESPFDIAPLSKFRTNYSGLFLYYKEFDDGNNKNMGKKKYFSEFVTNRICMAKKMVFSPFRISDNRIYKPGIVNTFPGYAAKLVNHNNVIIEGLDIVLDHIEQVWANSNEEYYNYILSWFITILKKPERKLGVALVLMSDKEGAGKSIIIEWFQKYIFGEALSLSVPGFKSITRKFNSKIEHKLFINVNEASSVKGEVSEMFDKMKYLITDSRAEIEKKNVDGYEADNFCNFIITTNHYYSLKISEYDRRYACFECSNKYVGNLEYFKILEESLNQATANAFVTYLYKYFDDIVDVRRIPQTSFRDELIERNKPGYQVFYNKLSEDAVTSSPDYVLDIDGQNWIMGDKLYSLYKEWCDQEGINFLSKRLFLANITKICGNNGKRRFMQSGKKYRIYLL